MTDSVAPEPEGSSPHSQQPATVKYLSCPGDYLYKNRLQINVNQPKTVKITGNI
jgi:hypothetical protein